MKSSIVARYLIIFSLLVGVLRAAVGEVTPLTKAELTKVEALLTKNLKGKPSVKSGEKEELDGGWKITCVAEVGSGGEFTLVVTSEKSMTLGTVVSQNPAKPKKA
jgi:F0F1-type ATP synthase delta subunit